ncbi:MAG: hypothetical protein ACK5W0_14875 [Labrys sp. (in: a-proteobacteria)]
MPHTFPIGIRNRTKRLIDRTMQSCVDEDAVRSAIDPRFRPRGAQKADAG